MRPLAKSTTSKSNSRYVLRFSHIHKIYLSAFQDAQKLFQISFSHCKQRLANLAKALGRCVERARPYYDACKQAQEVSSLRVLTLCDPRAISRRLKLKLKRLLKTIRFPSNRTVQRTRISRSRKANYRTLIRSASKNMSNTSRYK